MLIQGIDSHYLVLCIFAHLFLWIPSLKPESQQQKRCKFS